MPNKLMLSREGFFMSESNAGNAVEELERVIERHNVRLSVEDGFIVVVDLNDPLAPGRPLINGSL